MRSVDAANILVARLDRGFNTHNLTLTEVTTLAREWTRDTRPDDLTEVCGYLAAQIVGHRHSPNADKAHAFSEVLRAVEEYHRVTDRRKAAPDA